MRVVAVLVSLSVCATARAQNDECTGALPLPLGPTSFDTTGATTR